MKLGLEEMNFMKFFESKTGTIVKDCIINSDVTIIVKDGQAGLAIGKKGAVIQSIKKQVGKEIHVYEYSEDPCIFIAKLFHPLRVEKVSFENGKAVVFVDSEDKKRAIGRNGKKIETVKTIVKRHFALEELKVQ